MRAVTLRDIAECVGVSRMTVSLALRGDGRVAEETRGRVLAVAERLGYAPNPRIGELMAETARTRHGVSGETLAFVTSEPTREGWRRFDAGVYESIERQAAQYGYRVEPWWIADPELTPTRVNQILWSRGIRGVIVPNISQRLFAEWGGTLPIEWERFCVVEIGGGLRRPQVNQVLHDHQAGLFLALDELENLGYRRIGLCLKAEDDLRTHHRWSGAYFVWRALRGHGSFSPDPLVMESLTRERLRGWVRTNRLEAVVSPGVLPLTEWGFDVPERLGFASLHLWGASGLPISGIDQDSDRIAAASVDLMMTLLRSNQKGIPSRPLRWLVGGRWIEGETTRRLGLHGKTSSDAEYTTLMIPPTAKTALRQRGKRPGKTKCFT